MNRSRDRKCLLAAQASFENMMRFVLAFQSEGRNNIAPGDHAWHRIAWGREDRALRVGPSLLHATSLLPQLGIFNALATRPGYTCCAQAIDSTTW